MAIPVGWNHWLRELRGFQVSFNRDLDELEKTLERAGQRTEGLLLLQQLTERACASLGHLQVLAVLVAADSGASRPETQFQS